VGGGRTGGITRCCCCRPVGEKRGEEKQLFLDPVTPRANNPFAVNLSFYLAPLPAFPLAGLAAQ